MIAKSIETKRHTYSFKKSRHHYEVLGKPENIDEVHPVKGKST